MASVEVKMEGVTGRGCGAATIIWTLWLFFLTYSGSWRSPVCLWLICDSPCSCALCFVGWGAAWVGDCPNWRFPGGILGRCSELPSIAVPMISSGPVLCPAEEAPNSHTSYTETVFWREIEPYFHQNRLFWPVDVSTCICVCFWPARGGASLNAAWRQNVAEEQLLSSKKIKDSIVYKVTWVVIWAGVILHCCLKGSHARRKFILC